MSPGKLLALNLPRLAGKSVLDVGCNAGFFCGFADFRGASRVVGVDSDPESISTARELFPVCQFFLGDWHNLPAGGYDIILYLDGLNYVRDQEAMLASLVNKLNPNGTLVLEVGYVAGQEPDQVEICHEGEKLYFPTGAKLMAMFGQYACKYVGTTVAWEEGKIGRSVYHLQKKMPVAVLFMDNGFSGKTAISTTLFREGITRVSGDRLYYDIMQGKREASDEFRDLVSEWSDGKDVNCAAVSFKVCHDGLLPELCQMVREMAGEGDFILDMYMPSRYRRKVCDWWDAQGYFVVDVALHRARAHPYESDTDDAEKTCYSYLDYLGKDFLLDEADYLAANPGVARAVADGLLPSAQYHYWKYGRKEGRPIKLPERHRK